jgi:hypothetical protein
MSLKQIYGVIVGECGVDPLYFFDEMTVDEALAIMGAKNETFKNNWEQTRAIMHVVAASQSSKPIKPSDVLPLPWDKESKKEAVAPTKKDMARFNKYVKNNKVN